MRRFRRLTPAVVLVTFTVAGAALIVGGDALVALPRQVLGSVSATYNWLEIGAGSSYFDKSSPLLLTNMWSLALEQQFYLVWPLIVLLVARRGTFTRVAVALTIGTASTLWHIHLLGDDVSRSYMGTDTHLWGLMMGAAPPSPSLMRWTGTRGVPASPTCPDWQDGSGWSVLWRSR